MNDVTLNSSDFKLVRPGELVPARALTSSPAASVAQPKNLNSADQAAQAQEAQEAQKEKLSGAVSQLNDYVQNVQRDLQFEVDNELGQTIVRVVDQETQKVIRQIPDELALRLAENLHQDEPLTLFNIKV